MSPDEGDTGGKPNSHSHVHERTYVKGMDEEPDDTNPMVFALVFLGGMVALGVGVYGFFFLMSIWPEL